MTNGVVLEIFTHFNNGVVDWCALTDSVYSIFGLRSESMPQTELCTLFNAVQTRKRKLLRKRRMNDLHAFWDEPFKRPNDGCHSNQETDTAKITRLTAENHKLKTKTETINAALDVCSKGW